MSKLTVTFKGIPLQSIDLDQGEIGIGRDPANAVHIDSLAIAAFHAVVRYAAPDYVIRQLQADFPLYLNGRPVNEERLNDGDHILIGKHNLYFTAEQRLHSRVDPIRRTQEPEPVPAINFRTFEGSFQVMNGKQIGMLIPLKNTITQIGKESSGLVIVTKGDYGYSIHAGSDNVLLTINGQPVGRDQAPLKDGDVVRINSSLLQFFVKHHKG